MTLELRVWSPALDLPSVDPQCLAAIAYLSYLSRRIDTQLQWQLVTSNDPSISPTKELPTLSDTSTGTTIGGLQNIIEYLRARNSSWDLDHDLENNPTEAADHTAFTSHVSTRGNILLALSFFVSTENYTTITRPTYSSILPWPTQYIIPPSLRSKARQLTAHLGLSSPDLDDNEDASGGNKSMIPDSLRTIGSSSSSNNHPKSLKETLAHQQTGARFRLEALVDDFCNPLSSLLTNQETETHNPYLLSSQPSSLDALASAYLNLMLTPSLPQNWLQTRLQNRWPNLTEYARRTGVQFWGSPPTDLAAANNQAPPQARLPWRSPPPQNVISRTVTSLMTNYLPTSTTIISAKAAPSTAAIVDDSDLRAPHLPLQEQPAAHTLPTVLLAATTFAAGLAAISSYVLLPYLLSGTGDAIEHRRDLKEMGEAGQMLSSMVEVEPPHGGAGGGVGLQETVEL